MFNRDLGLWRDYKKTELWKTELFQCRNHPWTQTEFTFSLNVVQAHNPKAEHKHLLNDKLQRLIFRLFYSAFVVSLIFRKLKMIAQHTVSEWW